MIKDRFELWVSESGNVAVYRGSAFIRTEELTEEEKEFIIDRIAEELGVNTKGDRETFAEHYGCAPDDTDVREEVKKRWDALGFTEGLHGKVKETIRELYEPYVKATIEMNKRLEKLERENKSNLKASEVKAKDFHCGCTTVTPNAELEAEIKRYTENMYNETFGNGQGTLDEFDWEDIASVIEETAHHFAGWNEHKAQVDKNLQRTLALGFMNYLDKNRQEGKMCLSNGECEDIMKAVSEGDWEKLKRYTEKYIGSDKEIPNVVCPKCLKDVGDCEEYSAYHNRTRYVCPHCGYDGDSVEFQTSYKWHPIHKQENV